MNGRPGANKHKGPGKFDKIRLEINPIGLRIYNTTDLFRFTKIRFKVCPNNELPRRKQRGVNRIIFIAPRDAKFTPRPPLAGQ